MVEIVGWCSQVLLSLVLVAAVRGRFFKEYRTFYAFVSGLLVIGIVRYCFYASGERLPYFFAYWYTQFLIVSGSYAVLWEIYGKALEAYRGAEKVARALVAAAFVGLCAYCAVMVASGRTAGLVGSLLVFEKSIHLVQSFLLAILIIVLWYYRVPLGTNVWGLVVGHAVFLTSRLLILHLQSDRGVSFNVWRYYLEPLSWLATITVWTVTLWAYRPNPIPTHHIGLDRDCRALLERTSGTISRARTSLARAILPRES